MRWLKAWNTLVSTRRSPSRPAPEEFLIIASFRPAVYDTVSLTLIGKAASEVRAAPKVAGPQLNWERAILRSAPAGRSPAWTHHARVLQRKTLRGETPPALCGIVKPRRWLCVDFVVSFASLHASRY